MCAIAGWIDFQGRIAYREEICGKMMKTMVRRGPDQEGQYIEGPAALLHRRLCVVDPQGGGQPFVITRGAETYVLVYNGELYNTGELRRELEGLGQRFTTNSDTEAVLRSYLQWGGDCVNRLNGIFAFAVWEKEAGRLFAARDRIGVKPFFYVQKDGAFLFASEIKTLLAHPAVEPRVDREGILDVMLLGPGRTPGTGIFRGIRELEPGTCGYLTEGGFRSYRYWALEDRENRDSFPETVAKVRYLVTDAIRRQLVSDVPVCTFLSGGLDSSIISALADRHFREKGQRLKTFSVGYQDNEKYFTASKFQPNSDENYIRKMNESLEAEHFDVILDSRDVAKALTEAVEARDLPGMADVDSSLLLFCREIKKEATVALSGECADEIFGGYPWYRDKEIREREGFPWAQSTDYRASFLKKEVLGTENPTEFVDRRYRETCAMSSILSGVQGTERRMKEMVNLNFRWFMQTLLDRKDRMSMYSGLEVRVPFCDYRIAEYLYTVPWEYKDYMGREKGLLREAVRGLLPEEVLWRKKSPYPKTHHPVYLQAVTEMLRQALAEDNAPILNIVRREALEGLMAGEGGAHRGAPWYGQLMARPQTIAYMIQVNYWMKKYGVILE